MKEVRKSFPDKGIPAKELISEMQEIKSKDASWEEGRIFGYVFYPGEETAAVAEKAYLLFGSENALNSSLFKSIKLFEKEIVRIVTGLLHGGPEAAGTFTSGGTESIFLAVKTARDKARAEHPEIKAPSIVVPESAHPAFLKAAHYLNVEIIQTPLREDKRADPDVIRKSVGSGTILLAASAPCFPHGVIDPIAEIAQIALEKKIPFHVDACMGGMLLPFVEKLGYPLPEYDFRVPGVTSISVDLHKYGYAPKGASVILYHDRALRRHQFFACTEWPGGLYGSAAFSGSRSGGPAAAAWATLMNLGNEGYLSMAKNVMETSRRIQAGIKSIEGLTVISNPDLGLIAFTSDNRDIFEVGDKLSDQNWFLDRIQFPNALHLTLAEQPKDQVENFISALRLAVSQSRELKSGSASSRFVVSFVKGLSRMLPEIWLRKLSHAASRLMGREDDSKHTMGAAVYGITSAIENRGNVHELVLDVLDNMY